KQRSSRSKVVDVTMPVNFCPGLAQFLQRGRTKGAEQCQAAGAQHTRHFCKQPWQILAPLDGKTGKHQIDAGFCERQGGGVGTHEAAVHTTQGAALEHGQGEIEAQQPAVGQTPSQALTAVTSAAAEVEYSGNIGLWREKAEQRVGHVALQARVLVVVWSCSTEMACDDFRQPHAISAPAGARSFSAAKASSRRSTSHS